MKKIKFGLKLWSTNSDLIAKAERMLKRKTFDYIELMIVPGTKISFFQKIKVPYIIHVTSDRWGLNIADIKKEKFNKQIIRENILWADKLKARYLILHPGFGLIKNTIAFLKKIKDRRILIENMPKMGINNKNMIGYSPEQINKLIGKKFGLCLDFNHTIKAAISLKKNYKEYIEDFLKLNPKIFHISDGNPKSEKDEHLNIGEGKYDFNFLANCINKKNTGYITLETPRNDLSSLEEDLKNLIKLKSFLY